MGCQTPIQRLIRSTIRQPDNALRIARETVGEQHPGFATCLHELAIAYFQNKEYPKAEALNEQAMNTFRGAFGDQHPHYAASLNSLAVMYSDNGDYGQAAALYEQTLDITSMSSHMGNAALGG